MGRVAGQRQIHGRRIASAHIGGRHQHCARHIVGRSALQVLPAFAIEHRARQLDHVDAVDAIAQRLGHAIGHQDPGDGGPAGDHHRRVKGRGLCHRQIGLAGRIDDLIGRDHARREKEVRQAARDHLARHLAAAHARHFHRQTLLRQHLAHTLVGEERLDIERDDPGELGGTGDRLAARLFGDLGLLALHRKKERGAEAGQQEQGEQDFADFGHLLVFSRVAI